jgi:uncharacterized protein (DUF1778 family)
VRIAVRLRASRQNLLPGEPLTRTDIFRTLMSGDIDMTRSPLKTAPGKSWRFDARLNEDQKILIQRAADLEGRTMTDFVLHSAEEAAERTIQQRAMLILSARQTEEFVSAILKPAPPSKALRKAAQHYKKITGVQ